jgi:uncharacterized protein with PQ loop repeat
MELDIFYLLGLLVVWYGNAKQVIQICKTKSTRSFSLQWIVALVVSIGIRLPRAWFSDYWVWQWGYTVSFTLALALLGVLIYFRGKYPRK